MAGSVTLAFSADPKRDADILALWDEWGRQGNRSAKVRAIIRASQAAAGLTLGDVMNELDTIKRELRSGVIVQRGDEGNETDQSEPVDPQMQKVDAALNALGNGRGC